MWGNMSVIQRIVPVNFSTSPRRNFPGDENGFKLDNLFDLSDVTETVSDKVSSCHPIQVTDVPNSNLFQEIGTFRKDMNINTKDACNAAVLL